MWHNTGWQMASAWRNTVVKDWFHAAWQKNYSNTYRRNSGGDCGQVVTTEGQFTPQLWSLVEDKLMEGLNGHRRYTLGYVPTSSAENFQILSHGFFKRFLVWKNCGVVKLRYQSIHKRFSTRINILVMRSLARLDSLAGHWNFFKVQDS